MHWTPLPFAAALTDYETQATALLDAWRAADADAVQFFRHRHPRFLRDDVPWLPKSLTDEDILRAPLDADDARLATARAYDFLDWSSLAALVAAVLEPTSPVARFEAAVEAVIDGDLRTLSAALDADPALPHARSTRVCPFDPARHRATLLHYVAANGVEGYRQRTPPNAVDIARCLLDAGADPDALADLYGGQCTSLSMLVSSDPPARAGVQIALIELLADRGATLTPLGTGRWRCPVGTALVFGFREAAHALVRRGAPVGTLPLAAGLGRVEDVERLLPEASAEARHEALALAVQGGEVDVLRVLLDAGEDPGRYNPPMDFTRTPRRCTRRSRVVNRRLCGCSSTAGRRSRSEIGTMTLHRSTGRSILGSAKRQRSCATPARAPDPPETGPPARPHQT